MAITIEKVRAGDAPVLAYIQTESWKAAFKDILAADVLEERCALNTAEAMYQRLLTKGIGNGYLLRVDGTPHCIAWWDVTREPDMPGYAELICIHSLPDRWHMGHGSQMMARLLDDVKAAGYQKMMLWVFAANLAARRFYEKHGFAVNGREKLALGAAEVCYEKTLT